MRLWQVAGAVRNLSPALHHFIAEGKGLDKDQCKFVDLMQELVLSEMEAVYPSSIA